MRVITYNNAGATTSDVTTADAPEITNEAALITKGLAYLALPTPTAAQTTKAVRALVMLQLQALDDVTGT